jgi:hypothetical protein
MMMKTTLHLHRPPSAPAASTARLVARPVRSSTVRLGVALSLAAAVITLVLEALLDVPVVLILVPVVIIGFALSWHACGRPLASGPADRRPDRSRDELTRRTRRPPG